jgi:(p)ppGpp synthase/HD superfamily hydrolase
MPGPTDNTELTTAEVDAIAHRFHQGQRDKSGRAYIHHPRAVAVRVRQAGGSVTQQRAALLHDVVEDTEATLSTLAALGVSPEVVTLVDAMTHRPQESHEDYLRRLSHTPDAVLIKRCDIAHNIAAEHMNHLTPATRARLRAKYARALRLLDQWAPD